MISELKIGNFKAFGPAQTIPLRPITLVFGPNSAGKSSIIQSLLLARHVQDTGNPDAHHTTLGGTAVDLGGFERYVHNHQLNQDTALHLSFKRSEIVAKLHYLDCFETLTLAFTIGKDRGNEASPTRQSAVVSAVTLFLDGYELIRLTRRADGNFQPDKDALETRSLFSFGAWTRLDLQLCWMTISLLTKGSDPQFFFRIAEQHDIPPSDFCDAATGKWNLIGCLALLKRIMARQETPEGLPVDLLNLEGAAEESKEHVVREVSGATFKFDGLCLSSLNPLSRAEVFSEEGAAFLPELHSPETDPYWFFDNVLRQQATWDDDADTTPSAVWASALRYDIECLIEAANKAISSGLSDITYLGPLRWIPPRHMLEPDEFDATWVAGGGDAWQRLRREGGVLDHVNRFLRDTLHTRYQLKCNRLAPELDVAAIERCIQQAREKLANATVEAIPDDFASVRVAEDSPVASSKAPIDAELAASLQAEINSRTGGETLTELTIVDSNSGLAVSHRDVGTGISQLLPVIVNAVAARQKLIAIEQPELHLHPALQAELGDVLIESALGANQNRFLIETHSEHLILRLLRRIRQTTGGQTGNLPAICADDIALLYVESRGESSVVHHLRVDEHGRLIDPCPGGFFEEDFDELF